MNKKLLTLLAAVLLCSCGDGVLNQVDEQKAKETKSRLYVSVVDYSDNNPIAGANLNLQSAGKTAKTAANGIAVFESINVGDHLLRIEATGYATLLVSPTVNEIGVDEDGGRATQERYKLYSKTASVEGYVHQTDAKGQIKALVGLPVRVAFYGCWLAETATESVPTDSKGKFKFDNLPAVDNDCYYQIETVGAVIGGQTYIARAWSGDVALKKGSKAVLDPIDVNNGVDLFTVVTYNRQIANGAETTPIVFTFSENIAADQQRKVIISSTDGYNVAISNNTITIKPASRWEKDFYVRFTGVKSVSGKTYGNERYPVEILSKDISALKVEDLRLVPSYDISYEDDDVVILFKKIEGADYNFYLEENGKVSKIDCGDPINSGSPTTLIYNCPIALDIENATNLARIGDNTNKLTVQAFNAQYESLPADLLIKETKPVAPDLNWGWPVCKPIIENGKILRQYYCDEIYQSYSDVQSLFLDNHSDIVKALGSGAASKEFSGNIYFDRAMKTVPVPVYAAATDCVPQGGTSNPCGRLAVRYEWLNEQVLSVKVSVIAGTPLTAGTYVNSSIFIRSFVGKNNLPFNDGGTPASSNLELVIYGTIPTLTSCQTNPFADLACDDNSKRAFCGTTPEFYNATPVCKTTYPQPCALIGLQGTYLCPALVPPPLTTNIFSENFEGALAWNNNFYTSPRARWTVGAATFKSGSYSAYVSPNADGVNNLLNTDEGDGAYLYQQITLPTTSRYRISFSWKGGWQDAIMACLVPASEFNTYGFRAECYDYSLNGDFYFNSSNFWEDESMEFDIPAGTYYLGFYQETWNGADGGFPTPFESIAVDDISIDRIDH